MASSRSVLSIFRSLGRRVPQNSFICRQCLHTRTEGFNSASRLPTKSTFPRNPLRFGSATSSLRPAKTHSIVKSVSFATEANAASQAGQESARKESWFPSVTSKIVAYWLLGSAASVFGLVVFGGLTRLTESGLSITEWKPVTGSMPPTNAEDWESEFSKYRSSPEFQRLNPHMTLEEFKSIYWMEWIHRQWGRFVGISFVLPAAYFVATKRVSKSMSLGLLGVAGLIGFQGFLGWWMVKSGLKDDLFAPGSHPRVSQYRLTAHLGAAFVCYAAMLWNGLSILRAHRFLASGPEESIKAAAKFGERALRPIQFSVAGLAALVFVTAMSGGLVAGLDAGLIYNEIPYMGEGLAPPKSELLDPHYSRKPDHSDLVWRNMLENPSLVQLQHRILATSSFASIMGLWAYSHFSQNMRSLLPRAAKRGIHGVVGLAFLQVTLGISTLLYLVPTHLASAHQTGSLFLFTWLLVLGNRIWNPSRTARLLKSLRNSGRFAQYRGKSPLTKPRPKPEES